jgi:hypothetical protein
MNVGEYNTKDLVKDNTKKKNNVILYFFCTIIFKMQEKGHHVLFQPSWNLDFVH